MLTHSLIRTAVIKEMIAEGNIGYWTFSFTTWIFKN